MNKSGLMPNHFHLTVRVNETTLRVTRIHSESSRTINNSIVILLRSYTRAFNKQENRSGALFRESTKAECINCFNVNPSYFRGKNINSKTLIDSLKHEYPQICFNHIHQNPVKAHLVKNTIDWEYSSAKDYAGLRNSYLINKEITKNYIII